MKKDYEISQEMFSGVVDEETRPRRFAIATNALVILQCNSKRHLLMVNVDPVKLNEWYPIFVSHNAFNEFKAENYGKLIEEFIDASENYGFSLERRKAACVKYLENYIGSSFKVDDFKKINEDRYWIKYSKSQDIWTIYLFENYMLAVDKITIPNRSDVALIPLEEKSKWVDTGVYNGLKIVDNMYVLLKDEKSILFEKDIEK